MVIKGTSLRELFYKKYMNSNYIILWWLKHMCLYSCVNARLSTKTSMQLNTLRQACN